MEVVVPAGALSDGAVGVRRTDALTVMTAVDDVTDALMAPFLVL